MWLAVFGLLALANGPVDTIDKDARSIRALEEGFGQAIIRKDINWLGHFYADDWISGDRTGFFGKRLMLKVVSEGVMKMTAYRVIDAKVRVFGDFALAQVLDEETSSDEGKDHSGHWTWLDVFARRNGRWVCIATEAVLAEPGSHLLGPSDTD